MPLDRRYVSIVRDNNPRGPQESYFVTEIEDRGLGGLVVHVHPVASAAGALTLARKLGYTEIVLV